jgi:hypothetical protein
MHTPRTLASALSCLAASLTALGCVSTTFVPTGDAYPPKPLDCSIEVFSSSLPDRGYEELGILEGEGSFWKADMEDLIPKLKEEACLAGGDAIILQSAQRYASGEEGVENMYAFATVVRWTP